MGTSISWPSPVRSRWSKAASTALADEEPDGLVGDDGRRVAGRTAGDPSHQVGDPAHPLDEVVVGGAPRVGTAGPEPAGAAVHDVRAETPQLVVGKPEARDGPRPHAVHEGVGAGNEPHQRVSRPRALEVEDDAALAAPEGEVDGRHAGALPRSDLAQHVALGRLDLDDVRPHVAQDPSRIGAEHDGGEIDDPVSGEWSVHDVRVLAHSGSLRRRGSLARCNRPAGQGPGWRELRRSCMMAAFRFSPGGSGPWSSPSTRS